ncbi:MAG: murein biosynthesis integral membrane protein MurJ [Oscillospiraceae bacterium]|nr:murein biosynthesis integral membrane protein MurJ [Oscillospiraceae bacterium]
MIDNKNKDDNKKAVKTVSMIIFFTAFSKILGLFRDMLMAHFYGGSAENAAFAIASRIPRDFFDIFFGASLIGIFIPVYNSFKFHEEKERSEFANIFLNVVILAIGLLALLGMMFSRQIINFITPGYDETTAELAANLLRILFPMIVFIGAVYTFNGILQSKGEFLTPALVSAVSNLGVIIYFWFLNGYFDIYGLGWAYLISWIIQLLTLAVPLIRKKYKYKFIINLKNPAFIKSLKMALPIMAGSWLIPVGMLIGQHFLSFSDESDFYISAFDYSTKIFLLVTGIITYGILNYIFPQLAQKANDTDTNEFIKIVKTGLSALFFIIMPVACLVYVLRGEAVAVLFNHGKFAETEGLGISTAQMFAVLAPSMIMFSIIEILNRVFYAKKLVRFPMIASLAGIAVNFILSWIFISRLNLTPVCIVWSVLICQGITAGILIIALKIDIKEIFNKKFLANIAKIVLSSGILLIIIKILYYIIKNDAFESNIITNILVAALIIAVGVCFYIGANLILKTEETKVFLKMLKKER